MRVIISPQIYYGIQFNKRIHGDVSRMEESLMGSVATIGEEVAAIQEEVATLRENMATREDVKNFIHGITRQHPCFEDMEPGETKS